MCLTLFPTCTPNLTIFPQVSGLNIFSYEYSYDITKFPITTHSIGLQVLLNMRKKDQETQVILNCQAKNKITHLFFSGLT